MKASTQLKLSTDRRWTETKLKNKAQKIVPKSLTAAFESALEPKEVVESSENQTAEEVAENSPIYQQDSSDSTVTFNSSSSENVKGQMTGDSGTLDLRLKKIRDAGMKILMEEGISGADCELVRMKVRIGVLSLLVWIGLVFSVIRFRDSGGADGNFPSPT